MDKLPRCPRGTRRNKQTKACEPKTSVVKTSVVKTLPVKTSVVKTLPKPSVSRKRCPNGMRRNRITQNCESSKPISSTAVPVSSSSSASSKPQVQIASSEPKEGKYAYPYQQRQDALQRLQQAKPEEMKQYKREAELSTKAVKQAIREVTKWVKERITELKKQFQAENGKASDLKKLAPTKLSDIQIKNIVSENTQHDLATRIAEFEYVLKIIKATDSDIDDEWLKLIVCYAAV